MLSSEVVLSGRYRLDERVATGGMGDVWRGTDQVLGRQVAVKVLLPALVSDPDFIARFRAEARIMAALRHPGIVQVFDCGEDDLPDGSRADYLVMEFVEGEPLSRRIEAAGRLGVAETMSVVAQAAQALNAAHAGGIVHRDVKPSNLLVQEDGTVVLVDFGVARSANVTSITSTNAVPGTALYMAPEQASGRPVSGATDIYALGAVAYCCLTGSPPFTGDNPLQVAVRHLDDEPPALPDDIPEPVRELVYRALAKDPADRFATGAAMADAARAAGADPSAATAVTPVPLRGATAVTATTRDDLPVVRPAAASAGRGARRGTLIGAVAAVAVALAGLAAALGAYKPPPTGEPAVDISSTAPAAIPSGQSEPRQGGGGTSEDEAVQPIGRPGGGGERRPTSSPTATAPPTTARPTSTTSPAPAEPSATREPEPSATSTSAPPPDPAPSTTTDPPATQDPPPAEPTVSPAAGD
ncbi:serine/threonine protein kinase [Micromonospora sp. PLK6-60]|uniref:serine/threonine-protein kinase n=1 Tax=Micromonospora sp. PLK6-60 TaxID=2873383 RepID=UPI001CA707D8|nr:serine/threonine-protein kinase [Micromonospora sp. PLK6-60]MBY8874736.1 serine/threonine protein kinase [Micromonospora sp. PLK6-60]